MAQIKSLKALRTNYDF